MSEKLSRIRRKRYKRAIDEFAQSKIGLTINKKMRLNKIIIIAQWAVIGALSVALIIIMAVFV